MREARRSSSTEVSLLIVRGKDTNTLRASMSDKSEVSQFRIQMDKISIPDKINFHKQASEILYSNLLKSYLNKMKLENKMVKLEEKMKREKDAAKGWKVQVKKLETSLASQESKVGDKKATKKMLEDKDKQIESLQKKMNLSITYHPQTEEILVIQNRMML